MKSYINWRPPIELADDFKFDYLGLDKEGYAGIHRNKSFSI